MQIYNNSKTQGQIVMQDNLNYKIKILNKTVKPNKLNMKYEIGNRKRRFTWPEGRDTREQNEQYDASTPNIILFRIPKLKRIHLYNNKMKKTPTVA